MRRNDTSRISVLLSLPLPPRCVIHSSTYCTGWLSVSATVVSPSSDAKLTETVLLTRATLDDGDTTVALSDSQPVQYVLLWITHLGGSGSDNSTEIREVSFRRIAD